MQRPDVVVPTLVAPEFSATRWIPATPTYVMSARSVKAAQHALRDVVDGIGVILGVGVDDLQRVSREVLQVDVFSPDPVAAMGVDLGGGIAVFSEALNPTIVVHLAVPEQTQAFFDRQRDKGLVTQSVIIDGHELFTAPLVGGVRVSWAIAGDWLWVHFAFAFAKDDGTAWFAPKRPPTNDWASSWSWASKQAERLAKKTGPQFVGFADLNALMSRFGGRAAAVVACARVLEPVRRVGVAIDSDGPRAAGRISVDLGPAAAGVRAATLPIPEGWTAASASSALGIQWNLDLPVLFHWLAPCAKLHGYARTIKDFSQLKIRSARAFVEAVDLDDKKGRGVVSVDLGGKTFFQDRLDDIPARSSFESDRTFGPLRGKELAIPFVTSVQYILTDTLGFVAMGDGLLAAAIGTGKLVAAPLFAVDIVPSRIPEPTWRELIKLAQFSRGSEDMIVRRMMRWQDGHITLAIDGSELVLEARGTRR